MGKGRKCKKIVLGNPLTEIKMPKHDMKAGLWSPIELLVVEVEGGVDLVYLLRVPTWTGNHLPAPLMSDEMLTRDEDDPDLVDDAAELDEQLKRLVMCIAS